MNIVTIVDSNNELIIRHDYEDDLALLLMLTELRKRLIKELNNEDLD